MLVLDNLSRTGVRDNLAWLRAATRTTLEVIEGDVRDPRVVNEAVDGCAAVVHLAAQVAVTTSLTDPIGDFEVNAARDPEPARGPASAERPPPLLYTSTNKVYGPLDHVSVSCMGSRWAPDDLRLRRVGIDETQPLDFHSPYGCSKGAADQYVLDYARIYGLPAVVFRMSCIYGPRQCGTADQGWVAHFARSAIERRPLTIFGDGKQVRDTLFVDDLVEAMAAAFAHMPRGAGARVQHRRRRRPHAHAARVARSARRAGGHTTGRHVRAVAPRRSALLRLRCPGISDRHGVGAPDERTRRRAAAVPGVSRGAGSARRAPGASTDAAMPAWVAARSGS